MGPNSRVLALAACTWVSSLGTALAQAPAPSEIGVNVGGLTTIFAGAPGGSIWVGRPLKHDWRLEGFLAIADSSRITGHESSTVSAGSYGVLARNAFRRARGPRGQFYYSFGVLGFFGKSRGYEIYYYERDGTARLAGRSPDEAFFVPPVISAVGVGVQRTLSPYLSIRADVQALTLFVVPIGARATAGIAVPFGRYAH